MGKRAWLALGGAAVFILLIFVGSKAQAFTQFRSGSSATVAANETVDSTMFIGGRDVNIYGTINGDLFCGAQNLNISGTVNGDVICGAQTINLSGHVTGDIRVGAQTINFTGMIDGNATIAAQTLNTDTKSIIKNDASIAGTDLNLNGKIVRDLAAGGANTTLGGEVGRDIKHGGKQLTLLSTAKVGGGIDYTSNDMINMQSGAKVGGSVTHKYPQKRHVDFPRVAAFSGAVALFVALMLLIKSFVLTALFPRFVHSVSTQGLRRPWWALLTGFLASIVAPIIGVLLFVTVIGIPLAITLLVFWVLTSLLSGWFAAYWLGRMIMRSQTNPLMIIFVGALVLLILIMVPYIGFFVLMLAFWMGMGMILLELKDRYNRPSYILK